MVVDIREKVREFNAERMLTKENVPVHKFTNKTDKTAHILCLTTPSGMEKMFEEIGKPAAADTFLPPPQMTSEEQKQQLFGFQAE